MLSNGSDSYLMKSVAAIGDDVGFLSRESEAEAEGFKADGTLFLVVCRVVAGDDGERSSDHGSVRMDRR